VGEYDLTGFKNIAKASETMFEVPKYYQVHNKNPKRSFRSKSAANRTIGDQSAEIESKNDLI
jgi:hypothetical protein